MIKRVLVVDDDRLVAEIVKKTLQDKGYEVSSAPDGEEALKIMGKLMPDLILLDVQMPKMDGYTFIMKKSTDAVHASIPVIVLTSLGATEPLFKRHGVKAYLAKPINPKILLEKIQAILPI